MTPLQLNLTISTNGKSYTLLIHAYRGEPASFNCPGEPPNWEIAGVKNGNDCEVPYSLWSSFEMIYKDEIEEAIKDETHRF